MHDRQTIIKWAKGLFTQDNWVILDTETTGLEAHAEIVELSIIDKNGSVLFDSFIRPHNPIPHEATKIHGITNEMVRNSPTFPQVWQNVLAIFQQNPTAIIYNADFDYLKLRHAAKTHGLLLPDLSLHCLMKLYSHYYGLCGNANNCSCRWHKLEVACQQMGIAINARHRALADAKLTLELLKAIANL